jgi:hypothetical protein
MTGPALDEATRYVRLDLAVERDVRLRKLASPTRDGVPNERFIISLVENERVLTFLER